MPIVVAGLTVLILLVAACGGAAPAQERDAEEQVAGEQVAAGPQLLYFYADW